jgi:hypothetical protein
MVIHSGMILAGKTEELEEKPVPVSVCGDTNPTWTVPGEKPGLHGEKPAANHLSHGTAKNVVKICFIKNKLHTQCVNSRLCRVFTG